eukprot:UN11453
MAPIHIANTLNEDCLKQDPDGYPMTYSKPDIKSFDGNDITELLLFFPDWVRKHTERICNLLQIKTKVEIMYDSDDIDNRGYDCLVGENKLLCLQNMIKKWYLLNIERDYANRSREWDYWFTIFGEIDENIIPKKLKKTNDNDQIVDALLIVFQLYMCDAF